MNILNFLFGSNSQTQPAIENASLQRLIPKMKQWKMDTVIITTSKRCSVCKIYEQKVYSFYGWNKKYNKLPEFLYKRNCPACNCCIGASIYFPEINTQHK